ncbi:hypothetical protein ABCY62_01720, partial [Acetivibrio clariflavus]
EYIRRAALFLKSISKDCKNALFRPADVLKRDFIIDIIKVCPVVANLELYTRSWCLYYIEWVALAEEGEQLALQFEDLYDPLIKLFERGVKLKMHKGCFEIGERNFINLYPGICSYASEEPFDISDNALERYDIEN